MSFQEIDLQKIIHLKFYAMKNYSFIRLFILLLFIGTAFQCSQDATKPTLTKAQLESEIVTRLDFKTFVSSSATNQIELAKMNSLVKSQIEGLSNEILFNYQSNIIDAEKNQKFHELTSKFSNELIDAFISLKGYLSSRFVFSQDDLNDLLVTHVNMDIEFKFQSNSSAKEQINFPYIDVCGIKCAVATQQANFETSWAKQIFYSGCIVGCL